MPQFCVVWKFHCTARRLRPRHFSLRFIALTICIVCLLPSSVPAGPGPPGDAPPPAVTVIRVTTQEVNPPREYVGRMEAIQSVALRARVEGFLEKVAFREGSDVNENDLLYMIEQAPYQARFNEAQAKVAESQAALKRARLYLKRLQTVKSGGVSASDLDSALSTADQAAARFEEAKANLEQARLNLNYTTIRAPIDGRIGRTAYTQGNLVGPGSQALAHIVQIDPIRVVYSMGEADLLEAQMAIQKGGRAQAYLQDHLVPRLKMPNGEIYPEAGQIDFIDNQVDPKTGTIAVRAIFKNNRGILLPGQFVTVQISLRKAETFPVIPQSAVMEDREGRYVFTVDNNNAVQLRRVVTGAVIHTQWVVESGLKAGETIVVKGVQKVTPGQTVNPILANPADKE